MLENIVWIRYAISYMYEHQRDLRAIHLLLHRVIIV